MSSIARPPVVLSFSSMDPTGATGIQSDVLTVAGLGCHPLSVVCAVLIRDTRNIEDTLVIDDDEVVMQARTLLEDVPVAAFRIGVLGSIENLVAVAEVLSDYPDLPLVVEPGLFQVSSPDDAEADAFAAALVELILPHASVVVTDRLELSRLLGAAQAAGGLTFADDDELESGADEDSSAEADENEESSPELGLDNTRLEARQLLSTGAASVLLTDTAGHGPQVINALYGTQGLLRTDVWERLPVQMVGARSTLTAAIAAGLAHGLGIAAAVAQAQAFTWDCLQSAYRPGMGPAVPDRLGRSGVRAR